MADEVTAAESSGKRFLLRNIVSLGFVSLFTDISSEMVYPLIPDLVKAAGGGAATLGVIEGVAEATANLFKGFSGYWSDKIAKRKPIIFLGYFLGAIAKPLLGLSALWQMVLGFRFLDRVGKGVRSSPRDAILADSTGEKKIGQWFGLHRMMDSLGAVAGPALATLLLGLGLEFKSLFFWALIPAGIGLVVILAVVREIPPRRIPGQKFKLEFRGLDRVYHKFLVVSCVFAMATFSNTFLILRAKDFGFSLKMLPLLYMVFNIVSALSALPAGMLSDRFGRRNVLMASQFTFSLCFAGFALAAHPWQIWVLFAGFGIVDGIKEGVPRALISDLVPSEKRSSAFGVYYAAIGLFMLPASALAGLLWKEFGPKVVFGYGAVIGIIALILLAAMIPNQINPAEKRIR